MGKMYTLDSKLLIGSPEIRIGEKVYAVDDRTKTVKKIMKLFEGGSDDTENTENALKLAFGDNYKEIEALDLPFVAYQELVNLVIAALTGKEPEEKGESFPQ